MDQTTDEEGSGLKGKSYEAPDKANSQDLKERVNWKDKEIFIPEFKKVSSVVTHFVLIFKI